MKKYYSIIINHNAGTKSVMLVEIPDPEVILGMVVAFFVGLGGLYLFYKVRPYVKTRGGAGSMDAERLEYYERQLIDMKIRLDALEIQGVEQKGADPNLDFKQFLEKFTVNVGKELDSGRENPKQPEPEMGVPVVTPGVDHSNAVDHVLHLITDKAMTSRDIRITLKRSREHTSRLMKKLFEEGYVQRTDTKPYAYQITQKGREKIERVELQSTTAA